MYNRIMGKVRRERQKLHIATNPKLQNINEPIRPSVVPSMPSGNLENLSAILPLSVPKDNLFADLKLDIDNILKPSLSSVQDDDKIKSVKSMKSMKSEKVQTIPLSKKDKLKLRREILLKKIDTVNQMKKELKIRQKRKKIPILGDTNPLFDALPTLDLLVKDRSDNKAPKGKSNRKKKGIAKAFRRKRDLVQGVNMFKTILADKEFKKNPLEAITKQIQVRFGKSAKDSNSKPIVKHSRK